ncbi:MAG: SRPBCC family protein [Chitinophagaceae bacterium]
MIIIYLLAAIIVGLLVGAAWMPKTFNIEKTIVIDKPASVVMDHVADLNYYSKWNPWQQIDKTASLVVSGVPKTPGHKYEWNGKKVGSGHLTLKDLDDRHIHFDLQFLKPFKSTAKDNWLFEPWGEGSTKITWQNSGGLPWPIARLVGPMMSKGLNRQFETGLKNLKELCEGEKIA